MNELIDNTRLISSKHLPNVKTIISPSKVRSTNVPIRDVAVANFFNLGIVFSFIGKE